MRAGSSDGAAVSDDERADDGDGRTYGELLRDRVFGSFFFANALSNTGNWFQNVAAGIVVFDLTGSNTAVGAVSMLQFAATLLLTPWAGGLTDRVNRRKMLLIGQAIAFSGAAGLAVVSIVVGVESAGGPWAIYVATAVIGLGAAIILPSLQAVVPALVERPDLDRAITLNSATFNIARGIGPVLAGLVVGAFGATAAFGVNAATYLPLLLVLVVIRPRGSIEPDDRAEVGSVADGLRWIRRQPTVVVLLVATLAVGWTSDPFSTLMPALADDLGHGETAVGLLVGAFGIGAAVTAPATDLVRTSLGRERVIGTGLVVVGVGLVVVALAPSLPIALCGAAISGSGFLLGVTGTNSELQRGIPEQLRGRVMAIWSVAFLGCRPVAAAVDGVLADLFSVRFAVAVGAGLAVAVGGAMLRVRPVGTEITTEVAV